MEKGTIVLSNGLRQECLDMLGGDEIRLDLALKQSVAYVQPNSRRPLEAQIVSQLARIAGEKHDRDERYQRAAKENAASKPQPRNKKISRLPQ